MGLKRDPQEIYARWLRVGAWLAFALALLALLLYAGGVLAPLVPLERLPQLWGLPVERFREQTGAPTGWDWIGYLRYGDYVGLAAVCLFAVLSLVCYLRVLPAFLRHGERLQAALVAAQILVLLAAASHLIPGAR